MTDMVEDIDEELEGLGSYATKAEKAGTRAWEKAKKAVGKVSPPKVYEVTWTMKDGDDYYLSIPESHSLVFVGALLDDPDVRHVTVKVDK